MPGTMSQADLASDVRDMLKDAASKFADNNDDFKRHLDLAAKDLARFRPRVLSGSVTLIADQTEYTAPTDIITVRKSLWGRKERAAYKPWETAFPTHLPFASVIEGNSGYLIKLDIAPTAEQIAVLGSTYDFEYSATHSINSIAANTTVKTGDRHLLLFRAVAQALQELAINGINKPVQLGPGVGSMPKNGTPGALADQMLAFWEKMAMAGAA